MSIEQTIAENTAAIRENNELLKRVLAASPLTSGVEAPKAETKKAETKAEPKADAKKAETKKAETKEDATDATDARDETLKKFVAWLSEFPVDHPETEGRQGALRQLLDKLGEEKISTITDAKKLGQLVSWLEDPAKAGKDRGFGPGRFAADPSEDAGADNGFDV